ASEIALGIWAGDAPSGLDGLASKAGATVLVLATTRDGQTRTLIWWRADGRRAVSAERSADAAGYGALGDFAARQLRSGRPSLRERTIRISYEGSLVSSFRSTTV